MRIAIHGILLILSVALTVSTSAAVPTTLDYPRNLTAGEGAGEGIDEIATQFVKEFLVMRSRIERGATDGTTCAELDLLVDDVLPLLERAYLLADTVQIDPPIVCNLLENPGLRETGPCTTPMQLGEALKNDFGALMTTLFQRANEQCFTDPAAEATAMRCLVIAAKLNGFLGPTAEELLDGKSCGLYSIDASPTGVAPRLLVGHKVTIEAIAKDRAGNVIAGRDLDWQSNESAVATASTGNVTATGGTEGVIDALAEGLAIAAVADIIAEEAGALDVSLPSSPPNFLQAVPVYVLDMTGTWDITFTSGENDCEVPLSDPQSVLITQTGADLSVVDPDFGTLDGSFANYDSPRLLPSDPPYEFFFPLASTTESAACDLFFEDIAAFLNFPPCNQPDPTGGFLECIPISCLETDAVSGTLSHNGESITGQSYYALEWTYKTVFHSDPPCSPCTTTATFNEECEGLENYNGSKPETGENALVINRMPYKSDPQVAKVLMVDGADQGVTEGTCGDSLLDSGEGCDDGNILDGDGCSAFCQVEDGFECTEPIPGQVINGVPEGGFEAGTPNIVWAEASSNFGTPICDVAVCGTGTGTGPNRGESWIWFGGIAANEVGSVEQTLVFETTDAMLTFAVEQILCDNDADVVSMSIDGNPVFTTDGADPACGIPGYRTITIDLATASGGPYNDGQLHQLRVQSETFATNGGASNFFFDDFRLDRGTTAPTPSVCTPAAENCILEDFDAHGLEGWTVFNDGGKVLDWGTTDDGFCGSGTWLTGNYSGAGVAACVDSDAAGYGVVNSFLCSPAIELIEPVNPELTFDYNFQVFSSTGEDAFEVLIGTAAPSLANIGTFTSIFSTNTDAGEFQGTGAMEHSLDLSAVEGTPEFHVCFRYGADFDWYAQVDNVRIDADQCFGAPRFAVCAPGGNRGVADIPLTIDTSVRFEGASSFAASGLPASLSIGADDGIIKGTPVADDVPGSPYSVHVTGDDQSLDFLLTIDATNEVLFHSGLESNCVLPHPN
jgi:cysteine-rich repeat protein